MVIGNKIKKLRELKNLTQDYMADQLQMSQSNYSRIESDELDLPFTKLQRIAEVLEISISDLVEFDAKYLFNNIINTQTVGGNVTNNMSPVERRLYEEQIDGLKREVAYLKEILELVKGGKL